MDGVDVDESARPAEAPAVDGGDGEAEEEDQATFGDF
jgi:hypothetical protein